MQLVPAGAEGLSPPEQMAAAVAAVAALWRGLLALPTDPAKYLGVGRRREAEVAAMPKRFAAARALAASADRLRLREGWMAMQWHARLKSARRAGASAATAAAERWAAAGRANAELETAHRGLLAELAAYRELAAAGADAAEALDAAHRARQERAAARIASADAAAAAASASLLAAAEAQQRLQVRVQAAEAAAEEADDHCAALGVRLAAAEHAAASASAEARATSAVQTELSERLCAAARAAAEAEAHAAELSQRLAAAEGDAAGMAGELGDAEEYIASMERRCADSAERELRLELDLQAAREELRCCLEQSPCLWGAGAKELGSGAEARIVAAEGTAYKVFRHPGEAAGADERAVQGALPPGAPGVCRLLGAGKLPCRCGGHRVHMYPRYDGTLVDWVRAHGHPGLRASLEAWHQLLRGLSCVHHAAQVHGDLKPENLLARWRPDGALSEVALTDLGGVDGPSTAAWAAPECYLDCNSAGGDVYASAVVCHWLRTAVNPPFGRNAAQLVCEATRGAEADAPGLAGGAADLLARALANDPGARPSADVLCQEVRDLLDGGRPGVDALLAQNEALCGGGAFLPGFPGPATTS